MPMRIKVCGITRVSDAVLAADLGASAIGLVFWPDSPRAVEPDAARQIVSHLPPDVAAVGVFVDAEIGWVREVAGAVGLSAVQLHGAESSAYCRELPYRVIKAVSVNDATDIEAVCRLPEEITLLVDARDPVRRGGTGRTADWTLAATVAARRRTFLAGGLTPENVVDAVERVRPYAVDASSGLESTPGIKDPARLRAFFAQIGTLAARLPTEMT